ncbi:MAG: serine/threonine-protein kinase [Planctomycetota bacterium]
MPISQEELKFFGLLVNKGQISKEAVLKCLAVHEQESQAGQESQQRGARRGEEPSRGRARSLEEIAVALGFIDRSRLEQLKRTGGEDVVEIPGVEILAKAGEGGTSKVFKAREKKSGRVVALKVFNRALFHDAVQRSRFVREARLLIELEHPNVVKGYKVGRIGEECLVFVMEFVDGDDLQDLLLAGMTFHEDAALYIVLQAARALEYLRTKGVVHRDIKPGNIMLTRDNTVKLIDLGFASSSAEASAGAASVGSPGVGSGGGTSPGSDSDTTLGTVHYISPEQARGQADVDVRSDIYSLGATLYQLTVGRLPFEGDSADEILAKHILETLSSPELKHRVSPYVHYFIEKMMAKDREIRYQSPDELIEDIEGQIRGKNTMMNPMADQEELLRKPYEEAHEAGETRGPFSGGPLSGGPLSPEQERQFREMRRRRLRKR